MQRAQCFAGSITGAADDRAEIQEMLQSAETHVAKNVSLVHVI